LGLDPVHLYKYDGGMSSSPSLNETITYLREFYKEHARVVGDSMRGKGIEDGDLVLVDSKATPYVGDVVVGSIDGELTLKTYMRDEKGAYLHAENPKYPDYRPRTELESRGVVKWLLRSFK